MRLGAALAMQATRWLANASTGYCNATDYHMWGDCEFGDAGSMELGSRQQSLHDAVAQCLKACARCRRCSYISVSREPVGSAYRDCSWFARCEMSALHTEPAGFLSGAAGTRKRGAAAAASAETRELAYRAAEQRMQLALLGTEVTDLRQQRARGADLKQLQRSYDFTPAAQCAHGTPLDTTRVEEQSTRTACLRSCLLAPACRAAQLRPGRGGGAQCSLFARCHDMRQVVDAHGFGVWRRRPASWPAASPARVRWRANVSLVIASYSSPLGWLGALPAGLVDVVLYQKVDDGADDDDDAAAPPGSGSVAAAPPSAAGGAPEAPSARRRRPTMASRLRELCVALCGSCAPARCAERVAYSRQVPNYEGFGQTRGGAREPHAYLQVTRRSTPSPARDATAAATPRNVSRRLTSVRGRLLRGAAERGPLRAGIA